MSVTGMVASKEQLDSIQDSVNELKSDRKQDILESRQAVSAVQLQLHGLTVDVAVMKGAMGELPQIKISLENLKEQASVISNERRAERKLAATLWTGLIGLSGILGSLVTWLLTGKKL